MYALTNCNILAKKKKKKDGKTLPEFTVCFYVTCNNLGWLVLFYLSPHCDHAFAKKVGSPGVTVPSLPWWIGGRYTGVAGYTGALPRWGQWASAVWGCLGGGGVQVRSARGSGEQQTPRGGAAAGSRSIIIPIHHHPPPALLDSCHTRHSAAVAVMTARGSSGSGLTCSCDATSQPLNGPKVCVPACHLPSKSSHPLAPPSFKTRILA